MIFAGKVFNLIRLTQFVLLLLITQTVIAEECGPPPPGSFGPFDYTSAEGQRNLKLVEDYHFTPKVEALISGKSGSVEQDLNYTLQRFPNHHRALYSVANYYTFSRNKHRKAVPEQSLLSFECYVSIAKQFAPHDHMIPLIVGLYHHNNEEYQKALAEFNEAEKWMAENPDVLYNLGLLHMDLGNIDLATQYAEKVQLNYPEYPLDGLYQRLKEKGITVKNDESTTVE